MKKKILVSTLVMAALFSAIGFVTGYFGGVMGHETGVESGLAVASIWGACVLTTVTIGAVGYYLWNWIWDNKEEVK